MRDALADIAKVEQTPRWMGKQASIILAPDKVKVEAAKRKLEKEKAEKLAKGEKVEGLRSKVTPELAGLRRTLRGDFQIATDIRRHIRQRESRSHI